MIGVLNIKRDLLDKLNPQFKICNFDDQIFNPDHSPSLGGLFVDWLPQWMDEKHFFRQAAILEQYVKNGIPVVLFDRYSTIDQKQYRWLSKFNVTFLEPCIVCREGFEWQPIWTEMPAKIPDDKFKREINLAYEGSLQNQLKSFEKYYKTYSQLFPDTEVVFNCTDLDRWKGPAQLDKLKDFENSNLVKSEFDFGFVELTILIGLYKDYSKGRLPNNLFNIMNKGCVPVLPIEHRFYATVWDQLIIRDIKDVTYALAAWRKVKGVIIEEIYFNLLNRFPEFKINYIIDKIKRCLMI